MCRVIKGNHWTLSFTDNKGEKAKQKRNIASGFECCKWQNSSVNFLCSCWKWPAASVMHTHSTNENPPPISRLLPVKVWWRWFVRLGNPSMLFSLRYNVQYISVAMFIGPRGTIALNNLLLHSIVHQRQATISLQFLFWRQNAHLRRAH